MQKDALSASQRYKLTFSRRVISFSLYVLTFSQRHRTSSFNAEQADVVVKLPPRGQRRCSARGGLEKREKETQSEESDLAASDPAEEKAAAVLQEVILMMAEEHFCIAF